MQEELGQMLEELRGVERAIRVMAKKITARARRLLDRPQPEERERRPEPDRSRFVPKPQPEPPDRDHGGPDRGGWSR